MTLLRRTTAVGYYQQNFLGLVERLSDHLASSPPGRPRERMWRILARQVILATGAIERPLVFAGNDRSGVMLAGAARTYLNRFGVNVGRRPVIITNHDSACLCAFDIAGAGIGVAAIIDIRKDVSRTLLDRSEQLGIEVLFRHTVIQTSGRTRVSSVLVAPVKVADTLGIAYRIQCDAVLMCGGWTPNLHLFS